MAEDKKINEKTYISIGIFIALIGAIGGGAAWLTSVHDIAKGALIKSNEIVVDQRYYRSRMVDQLKKNGEKISTANERLSNIEAKVDILLQDRKPNRP